MIQATQTASVGTSGSSLSSGILPVFAAHIADGVESAKSNREVVEAILRIQKDLRAVCCQCGKKWSATFISRSYARRVCNLARGATFHELMQELERRLNGYDLRCPQCGRADDDLSRDAVN